jgi:hypothetical protein
MSTPKQQRTLAELVADSLSQVGVEYGQGTMQLAHKVADRIYERLEMGHAMQYVMLAVPRR